jgi:hypothetical protein
MLRATRRVNAEIDFLDRSPALVGMGSAGGRSRRRDARPRGLDGAGGLG